MPGQVRLRPSAAVVHVISDRWFSVTRVHRKLMLQIVTIRDFIVLSGRLDERSDIQ
ncbi:MAG: hypothetical protein ACKO14_05255 [Armatimonadota bacterium]